MKFWMNAQLGLLMCFGAVACQSAGPDYQAPQPTLSTQWNQELGPGLVQGNAGPTRWWEQLQDPTLDTLVERALRQGLDVREALARVREARARRGVAESYYLPTVDVRAGFERRADSDNTPLGAFVPDYDTTSIGFDATWEIDLWGRVARSVEAADAEWGATIEQARDVAVTVAAEIARAYVDLRAYQRRLSIARRNVELQVETLALVRARFEAGLVGERDLAQARTIVESTRARVPTLESGLRAAEHRIAVLMGEVPGQLPQDLSSALRADQAVPVPTIEVAIGVPADLVRHRADVRRAERFLAAEHARIGVAEADLYPRLSLLGNLGFAAEDVGELFDADSRAYGIGPAIRWNLFDRDRARGNVAAQSERVEQALVQWERSVLRAVEESENALGAFVREQVRRGSLLEAARQARLAVGHAEAQYREGLTDFQAVIDSQRSVANLEDELAVSDAAVTTNLIALCKALGGGFERWEPALSQK